MKAQKVCATALVSVSLLMLIDVTIAQATHNLSIRRHSTVSLDNTKADTILSEASTVIKVDDDAGGADDVACDVTLARSGTVGTFSSSSTPSTIGSSADYDAVRKENSHIKVVEKINFCGAAGAGTYAGCSDTPGKSIIVAHPGSYRGIVWAHEFGHNTGLPDRPGKYALMSELPLAADQKRVTQAECDKLVAGPPAAAVSTTQVAQQARPEQIQSGDNTIGSLLDLSRTVFVNRIPYSYIARHDASELPTILPLLYDFSEQESWSTIVTIAGILGSKETGQILIDFIQSDLLGANPSTTYQAKSAALIALGYLLNRTGDIAVMSFLVSSAQPRAWARGGSWIGVSSEQRRARIEDLQEAAMIGLALSGLPEVEQLLKAFAIGLINGKTQQRNQSFAEDLSGIHTSVKTRGLAQYYAR